MKHVHRIEAYLCLLATSMFVMNGCRTTYIVTPSPEGGDYSYNDLNSEFLDKEAVINLNDGRVMEAKEIRVDADSVLWNESVNGNSYRVAVGEVKTITARNHLVGALEGFGFGVLADGVALGLISSVPSHEFPIGGFFLMLGLPPLVAVLGAVSGHRYEYSFSIDSTETKN